MEVPRRRSTIAHIPAAHDTGSDWHGDQLDLDERHSLRRVAGIRTDLEDITEVEYR